MKKNISFKDITFLIVTYRSNKIIKDCLNLLPKECDKIIVENSSDIQFKNTLEREYSNLKCILSGKNIGYGAGNNLGLKYSQTDYIFIINPDVLLYEKNLMKIIEILNKENFDLAAPISLDEKNNNDFENKEFLLTDEVKGFAMILKRSLFKEFMFDENIFLYLEEIDLCKRIKKNDGKIVLLNVLVHHVGGNSHGNRDDLEMEKSRNWHWMWSKFYFYKKHMGIISAFAITLPNFFNCLIKYVFYRIFGKKIKYTKYKMRLFGLFSSYLNKKSFYRPYEEIK